MSLYMSPSNDAEVVHDEAIFTIKVDYKSNFTMTDLTTASTVRTDGEEKSIVYESEIDAYTCDDSFPPSAVTLTQGDILQVCVRTINTTINVEAIDEFLLVQSRSKGF